jgi:hypothetical protein
LGRHGGAVISYSGFRTKLVILACLIPAHPLAGIANRLVAKRNILKAVHFFVMWSNSHAAEKNIPDTF